MQDRGLLAQSPRLRTAVPGAHRRLTTLLLPFDDRDAS
jgi:hypothetical protein